MKDEHHVISLNYVWDSLPGVFFAVVMSDAGYQSDSDSDSGTSLFFVSLVPKLPLLLNHPFS